MAPNTLTKQLIVNARQRLKTKTAPPDANGCLLWTGAINDGGYGVLSIGDIMMRAHRVAWIVEKGDIPKGMYVCHKCDVRRCINVDHLFVGTQKDNIADMISKKRDHIIGERNAHHKLTSQQVDKIRLQYANGDTSYRQLAKDFGVCFSAIRHIVKNTLWKHGLAP